MEKSFSDLLSDAFAETSGLSFPDEDLDFESLDFGTVLTQDEMVDQEEVSETASLQIYDDVDETFDARDNIQVVYTSSEEDEVDDAKIDVKSKDFSAMVYCSIDNEEVSTMVQSLDQIDNGKTQVTTLVESNLGEQGTCDAKNIQEVEARQEDYTSSEDDDEEVCVSGQPLAQNDNGKSQVRHEDRAFVEQVESSLVLETASTHFYNGEQETCGAKNIEAVEVGAREEDYTSSEEECEQTKEMPEDFVVTGHCSNDNEEILAMGGLGDNLGETLVNQKEVSRLLKTTSTCVYDNEDEMCGVKNIHDVAVSVRQEDYVTSEKELGENKAEIGQKPGNFIKAIHCSKDDEEAYAMGQLLAQNDNDKTQFQEEGNFASIPGLEDDFMIQENSSDSDEEEEDVPKTTFFQVEYTLEYPEISYDKVEDLNDDEFIDKMEDFSGEEHQDAGESIAEYPSDFSSCEYVESMEKVQESKYKVESLLDTASNTKMNVENMRKDGGNGFDTIEQESVEKVGNENVFLNKEAVKDCIEVESKFYSQPKGDAQLKKQEICSEIPKDDDGPLQSLTEDVFSTWSISEEATKSYNTDNTDVTWEMDTATPLNSDAIEKLASYYYQHEGDSGAKSCSSRGSVDDSFFFNSEPTGSEVTEEGQLADDEFEEDRKWEQERINAFYKFYDNGDGDSGREERQTKVQFCTEALSQVIHYDTDSSDDDSRDSLSGSSDTDEDLDLDLSKPDETETCPSQSSESEPDSSNQEPPEPEDITGTETRGHCNLMECQEIKQNKQMSNRKNMCWTVLKLILSLLLVVVMGFLMFWWVTDAAEWPGFPL